ncbi:hypothetical protein HOU95_gp048 [Streptomyces phage Hiyaa]|jgi:hypothetical protein|uniref:Uncharacterized protein n=1 Tax=Streptomyces phage Hiyaa TaxID=2499072 RepID=A0A3S9U971_9CAUD|nr:hypothetical protein HOU95_gp048 [Streptomyces phage Hiyaa]AZS06759.1 hypothetical protein SEA_HIYAA_120 [Streptomyces phage Hiyaa]
MNFTLFTVERNGSVYEVKDGEGNTLDACPVPNPETPEAYKAAITDMVAHVIEVQSQFLG